MTDTATTIPQLARFAECVFERGDIIEIRRLPSGQSTWHVAAELPGLLAQLKTDNTNGQGVYVGINPRRERGGKTTADVSLARCLFADFDDVGLDGARKRWQAAGLPEPTLTVNSGHGVHLYLRLEESIDNETWTGFQRDLAAVLESDPSVHDPPRLARLPGFVNHKEPVADCTIIDAAPSRVYELAELHEHIPERPEPESTPSRDTAVVEPHGLDVLARAARYAGAWEGVVKGQRNSVALRHAALLTHDFGLSDDAAWPILVAWNSRNSPPLNEDELRQCLQNGRTYGRNEVGCKADSSPPSTQYSLPTDTAPEDAGPPWWTVPQIGERPSYRTGLVPVITGFTTLDQPLRGGFRPENTHIIGGRTGSAKSTLGLNIARYAAIAGHNTLIFKLEESEAEAVWRLHAAAAQVDLATLLDGSADADEEDRNRLADGWNFIRELPIRLSSVRELDAIGRISREHVREGGELIIIDQLSMIRVEGADVGFEAATIASNTLRLWARELHVPIVIIAQVNRAASKDKNPLTVHDLRDSGAIENDAASVILVDRSRRADGPRWHTDPYVLELHIGKNRYGPQTDPKEPLRLSWWPWFCRIEDPPRAPVKATRE